MKYTSKNRVYHRYLSDFSGMDTTLHLEDENPGQVVYMENMWRDYTSEGGAALESFPGMRAFLTLPADIHGIWIWEGEAETLLVIHAGTSLYGIDPEDLSRDSLNTYALLGRGLADGPSSGFSKNGILYLLDGETLWGLRKTGNQYILSDMRDSYCPITYLNGKPYEARNMLSQYTIERYMVASPVAYSGVSEGLRYGVMNEENRTCQVVGVEDDFEEETLYIPATVVLGGERYAVTAIGRRAFFGCLCVKQLYVGEGVQTLDTACFYGMAYLTHAVLPDSVTTIGNAVFQNTALEEIYLGKGLRTVGNNSFWMAPIRGVIYHGDAEGFSQITWGDHNEGILDADCVYQEKSQPLFTFFDIHEPVIQLVEVKVGDVTLTTTPGEMYYIEQRKEGVLRGVSIYTRDGGRLIGETISLRMRVDQQNLVSSHGRTSFYTNTGYRGTLDNAVAHCTRFALFDGRVFYAGNPDLPGVVFYTSRRLDGVIDPAYVGVYQYFDTDGTSPVKELLATASYLAVFRGDTRLGASVSYHKGQDTEDDLVPRIYPSVEGVSFRGCMGGAVNFLDDPVFLSEEGLEAISKATLNLERTVTHRSTAVDPYLTKEDFASCHMSVWQGYLLLLFPNGVGYLADSRRWHTTHVGREYEWYRLTGIGGYRNDIPVYRYTDALPSGAFHVFYDGGSCLLEASSHVGELAYGATLDTYHTVYPKIYSAYAAGYGDVYYTTEEIEGEIHCYALQKTGERAGGTFLHPRVCLAVGERLLVGCEGGVLLVSNTDRRGCIPKELRGNITEAAFRELWGDTIHPFWYHMAGHAMLSGIVTAPDGCGIPHYEKKTVRKTTIAEMKLQGGGGCRFQVAYHRGGYRDISNLGSFSHGDFNFSDVDLGSISFLGDGIVSVPLREKTKPWVRKQYRIYSDTYGKPFGIYRISYSYRPDGRQKIR